MSETQITQLLEQLVLLNTLLAKLIRVEQEKAAGAESMRLTLPVVSQ